MPTAVKLRTVPATPNFAQLEEETLAFWKESRAFEESVSMRSPEKPYVFYDGPPFATGMPHYGHLLGSTSKDVVPRYWTMRGYRVERIWGWDCHGLPIETMIQKQLGISGQLQDIEAFGIDKFNAACRSEVLRLDGEWERIINRLGRWVDFEHNYKTMDTSYMESVWWGFKRMWEKGLVYEGKRVIMYSPSSMTPLSNFEIAMDNSYKEVTEPATTYKYPVVGKKQTYLLAWSTTPWNKIATPALAVNTDITYVRVQQGDEQYLVAESRVEAVIEGAYEVVGTHTGAELTEWRFEPHYDFYAHERTENERIGVIVADSFVSDEEGTGVVTLAVYGEDDYRVMQAKNIQLVEHVELTGHLKPEVTPWAGLYYLKVNKLVDEDLNARGLIYKQESYTHSVPLDYRTGERVYYAPVPAWFINIAKLKPELLKTNEAINWFPEHLKEGRFKNGLENAPDWNISRSRFWGTPLPIWKSKDGTHQRVIGSLEELKTWAVDQEAAAAITDIHRENLDNLRVWVDDAKTIAGARVPEVFDCWVESGSMPFASRHYPFEHKDAFEQNYPAQFISEYIAQTRAWFYTMHVISVALFGTHAFENVLTTGTILAEDGSKMSKSKKNYPDPMQLIDAHGVDSLRLYLMSSSVMKSENLNFNEREVLDLKRNVFTIWWNVLRFYKLYGPDSPVEPGRAPEATHVLDRWMLSRMHHTIQLVTEYMDAYNVVKASRALIELINEISTWYLRRSRDRLRSGAADSLGWQTLSYTLVTVAQLFAPFTPFFSELVYQALVDEQKSIHHTDWPTLDPDLLHPELERKMELGRKVVERVHALRSEAGIKVRQPLASATVRAAGEAPRDNVIAVLKEELNLKELYWQRSDDELEVTLDTSLNPELEAEGAARELMRSIQKLRRQSGLRVDQHATVTAPEWPENWQSAIEERTNCTLVKGDELALSAE